MKRQSHEDKQPERHSAATATPPRSSEWDPLAPVACLGLDSDNIIRAVNPAAATELNTAREDIIGIPLHALVDERDIPVCQAYLKGIHIEPDRMACEMKLRRGDGSVLCARLQGSLISNAPDDGITCHIAFMDIGDYRNAEASAREKAQLFQQLVENTTDIISRHKPDSTFTYVSPSCRSIWGFEPEELIGQRADDFVHPEDRGGLLNVVQEARIHRGPWIAQFRHRTKDERYMWMETISHVIIGTEAGDENDILCVVRNINERKCAEESLRQSEAQYRLLAENLNDVIWVADMNLNFTYVTPSVTRLIGYTPDEVLKLGAANVLTRPSFQAAIEAFTEEVILENTEGSDPRRARRLELEHLCKDGTTVWTEMTISFVRDSAGRATAILGVSRNITDRKRTEEALRESEALYRLLAENINDVIWVIDKDLKFTYVSPSVNRLVGYTPEEAVLRAAKETLTPASFKIALKAFKAALEVEDAGRGEPLSGHPLELELTCKDGSTVWTETTASFLRDEDGRMLGIMGVSRDISARKRAEDALRENEIKYRLLAENVSDVIGVVDMNLKFTYVSPSIIRLAGYTPEEATNRSLEEALTPASYQVLMAVFAEEMAMEEAGNADPLRGRTVELEHTRKDGSTVWTETTASYLRDENGRAVRILGVSRDITERKRAMQEIEALSKFPEENPHPVLRVNLDGILLYANRASDYLMSVWQLKTASPVPSFLHERITRVYAGGLKAEFEDACGERTYSFVLMPIAMGSYVNIYARDITQQRSAEIARQESERKYRHIVDTADEGIWAIDENDCTTFVNARMAEMLGYSPEELLGRTAASLMFEEDRDDHLQRRCARRQGVHGHYERRFRHRDGTIIWTSVSAMPLLNTEGRYSGSFAMFTDISDHHRAEIDRNVLIDELEAKNAELERFAYTVSHDLKSPLVTIRGFVGYLEQDARSGNFPQLKDDITRINGAVDKMAQLLNELLELSRIGRMLNPPKEIPFDELAREATNNVVRPQVRGSVTIVISAGLPSIYGDPIRLREVVENLVDNAVKYMGSQPSPRIEIGARYDAPETIFYIRDNGKGIAPRYHRQIFELFTKLDPQTEGTGVGLALVKRIIEVHGGRIWVESQGEGQGSTFCFVLPSKKDV